MSVAKYGKTDFFGSCSMEHTDFKGTLIFMKHERLSCRISYEDIFPFI